MTAEKLTELFIAVYFPRRNYFKVSAKGTKFRANRYWVKRAVRVLKRHRKLQRWIADGNACSPPDSGDPQHYPESIEEFINVAISLDDYLLEELKR